MTRCSWVIVKVLVGQSITMSVLDVGTGKVFTCLNIIYDHDGSYFLAVGTGKVFTCLNIFYEH